MDGTAGRPTSPLVIYLNRRYGSEGWGSNPSERRRVPCDVASIGERCLQDIVELARGGAHGFGHPLVIDPRVQGQVPQWRSVDPQIRTSRPATSRMISAGPRIGGAQPMWAEARPCASDLTRRRSPPSSWNPAVPTAAPLVPGRDTAQVTSPMDVEAYRGRVRRRENSYTVGSFRMVARSTSS